MVMHDDNSKIETDPVIEIYKKDIDLTLIRENLRLSIDQRFEKLMQLQKFANELKAARRKFLTTND